MTLAPGTGKQVNINSSKIQFLNSNFYEQIIGYSHWYKKALYGFQYEVGNNHFSNPFDITAGNLTDTNGAQKAIID